LFKMRRMCKTMKELIDTPKIWKAYIEYRQLPCGKISQECLAQNPKACYVLARMNIVGRILTDVIQADSEDEDHLIREPLLSLKAGDSIVAEYYKSFISCRIVNIDLVAEDVCIEYTKHYNEYADSTVYVWWSDEQRALVKYAIDHGNKLFDAFPVHPVYCELVHRGYCRFLKEHYGTQSYDNVGIPYEYIDMEFVLHGLRFIPDNHDLDLSLRAFSKGANILILFFPHLLRNYSHGTEYTIWLWSQCANKYENLY
jgi:hypothetical protein